MTWKLIVTCEHGGHKIPRQYFSLFRSARETLPTHRGWDAGALPLARRISECFNAPLILSTTSRLLVDLNRSVGHPRLFSEWSRKLSQPARDQVLENFYHPFRDEVIQTIQSLMSKRQKVLHLSVHTFTPELAGKHRKTDVGLLYDPRRLSEKQFARLWKSSLQKVLPRTMCVHCNQPYQGVSDGFTTSLRRQFDSENYLGIELEISQKWLTENQHFPSRLEQQIVESLSAAWTSFKTIGSHG
ncbi:MAG: N-formylglutamate amidohydrolase [Planctomycetaceae bacterium]|nr:N-formylglutamate amidohydrolase [Planctomycetaceae bacterium]